MSLKEKEKIAISRLKSFEPESEPYYLCYSGGKDSDCIRILAQLSGVKHEIHHNLTTVDAPETVQYVKSIPDVTQPEDKRILLMDILESGMPVNAINGKSRTIKAQYSRTGSANALRGDGFGATMVHDGQAIRKLSPVEAERLQTLPDNYTAGISDTQR